MDVFLQRLKVSVGDRTYRIARLHWLCEWRPARIAKHLRMHRGNVGRHLARARRAALTLAASMGVDPLRLSVT